MLPERQLPSKVVQQVLRQLEADWHSYFAALRAWQVHPETFTGRPRLPHYKHKTAGQHVLVYVEHAYFKRDLAHGRVRLSGLGSVADTQQRCIDQVRIVPHKTHYSWCTSQAVKSAPNLNPALVAAGDLGIDTLLALTSNQPGFVPLLVSGRPLKAINQGYNQHCADLQSRLMPAQHTSRQLAAISDKRNRRIKAELHRCARLIIDTLVIGKNIGWKQAPNLGSRTNQNFVSIPHTQFIHMLSYKAALVGINLRLTEESYTSKCNFLDLEPIANHQRYAGRRVHRGLFRVSSGHFLNADVNVSYNILRKVLPNAFADGIGAAVVQPVRVYPRAN